MIIVAEHDDSNGSDSSPSADNLDLQEIVKATPNEFQGELVPRAEVRAKKIVRGSTNSRPLLKLSRVNLKSIDKFNKEALICYKQYKGSIEHGEGVSSVARTIVREEVYAVR